jgi:hypothetical protein
MSDLLIALRSSGMRLEALAYLLNLNKVFPSSGYEDLSFTVSPYH